MSQPDSPRPVRSFRAFLPLAWISFGIAGGVVGSQALRPTPKPVVIEAPKPPAVQKDAPPPKMEEIPPVDPMAGIEILPADQPFGVGESALRGPLSKEPLPEAPKPAEPIEVKAPSAPPLKRIKRPIDLIVERGLPEPPKPAEPKVVRPDPKPVVPLVDRVAQFLAFATSELHLEPKSNPDGDQTVVDVTAPLSSVSTLRAKADELGGRLLSQSNPAEDAVQAAEARLAALRQWRKQLLETLDASSRPVAEADRDIATAEKALDEAKAAVPSDRANLQFRFR